MRRKGMTRHLRRARLDATGACCNALDGPLQRFRKHVMAPHSARARIGTAVWRWTHLRSVSAVQPILLAIAAIAAHCDSCSACCSSTNRTARSRTSGAYLLLVLMTPSSQDMESPGIPGWFIYLQSLGVALNSRLG